MAKLSLLMLTKDKVSNLKKDQAATRSRTNLILEQFLGYCEQNSQLDQEKISSAKFSNKEMKRKLNTTQKVIHNKNELLDLSRREK